MNRNFLASLRPGILVGIFSGAVLSLSGPVPGQGEETAAEKQFQSAFWLETGKGQLDEALRGYLAAADVAGPEATRARALLRAAIIQHRLRQGEPARATIEKLIATFPKQTEIVASGRRRLAEWGRIALRSNYSDWYQQHLFTPAVQAKILNHLQELGRKSVPKRRSRKEAEKVKAEIAGIEKDILVYGQGAVPALTEMARTGVTSGQRELTSRASRLIFLIGRLPPIDALFADEEWMSEERAWRTLFRLTPQERQVLSAGLRNRFGYVKKLLTGAVHGPQALTLSLTGDTGGELSRHHIKAASAILWALHSTGNPNVVSTLVSMSKSDKVAIMLREKIEWSVSRYGWPGASAKQWLDWSRGCLVFDHRATAISRVGERLRREDGKSMDGALSDIEGFQNQDLQERMLEALHYGLGENSRPLHIPWTEDRLFRLLQIGASDSYELNRSLGHWWRQKQGRKMIAAVLLRSPSKLHPSFYEDDDNISNVFRLSRGGESDYVFETAWGREIAVAFAEKYGHWSVQDRMAGIRLVSMTCLLDTEVPYPKSLRKNLNRLMEDPTVREVVEPGLERLAKKWPQGDSK